MAKNTGLFVCVYWLDTATWLDDNRIPTMSFGIQPVNQLGRKKPDPKQ